MDKLLQQLGFTNEDGRISFTNLAMMLFIAKALFSGISFTIGGFSLNAVPMDLAATLPLLASFANYGHKRAVVNKEEPKA